MERAAVWSVRLLLALPVVACAAEPGFYVGATASRVEQDLDERAGVGPIPVAVLVPPPTGGFFPVPFPPGPLPPIFGGVIGVVAGPAESHVDETDVGWSFTLGYRVNKYLAAEVAYVDFGEATLSELHRFVAIPELPPLPDITRSYTVSTRGPALSVLGSFPVGETWEVFVRGGVLFAEQEIKTRTSAAGTTSSGRDDDFSDEVVTLGAGVQWSFLPRWTARLEYQRTDDLQRNDIMGESSLEQASLGVLFSL